MSNVVKLSPGARSLVILTDSPASIKLVQRELLHSKRTYTDIARGAVVSTSTISNIASGQTRWPRIETIIRILGSLGWVISATRNG